MTGIGIGAFIRQVSPVMNEELGPAQSIELRRKSQLAIGEEAVPITDLVLVHDTGAGATTLDLALVTEESYPLTGSLLASTPLAVGGHTYKLTAPAVPTGNLITVAIDPPLVADADEGDPVTLTPYVPYTLASCRVAHKSIRDAQLPAVVDVTTAIIPQASIDASGVPGGVQLEDDLVLDLASGEGDRITSKPIASPGFVKVLLGA